MSFLANTATESTGRSLFASKIFALVAFAILPLAAFAPLGIAPLALVAAAGIAAAQGLRRLLAGLPLWLPAGLLGFVAFGAVTAFWAIDPLSSIYKAGQLLFIFLAGLVLCAAAGTIPDEDRPRVGMALFSGAILAAGILLVERYMQMPVSSLIKRWPSESVPLFWLNRASVLFAMLSFPVTWVAYRRWGAIPALTVIGGSLVVVLGLKSNAAIIGLVLGLGTAVAAYCAPHVASRLLVVTVVVFSVTAPLLAPAIFHSDRLSSSAQRLQSSAYHRLMIWNFAAERIAERPFLGWGLDSSRAIPQGHQQAQRPSDSWSQGELLPLHPHNAAIQIWLELGLLGLLIGLPLIAMAILRARRALADDWGFAATLGSVATISVVAFASFGIWQSWWLCAIWIAISLCIAIMGGDGKSATVVTSRPQTRP